MDYFYRLKEKLLKYFSKFEFSQEPIHLLLAIVTGILAGFGGILFYKMIQLVEHLMFYSPAGFFGLSNLINLRGWERFVIIPIIPAIGGLVVGWITIKLAPDASGEGVPMVIENVAKKGGILNPFLAVTKLVTSAISIGSGGAGGREGPVIAIGGAIGSTVGQVFRLNEEQMKSLVGCGAAAGLAAVFNAPIGGALFAMEVVIGSLNMQTFSPIIISSVFGTFVSRSILGNKPVFVIPTFSLRSGYELIFYVILGLFAGFVGVLFVKLFYATEEFFESKKFPVKSKILKPAIGGLIVGIIGIYFPEVFGYTYQGVNASLYSRDSFLILAALLLLKPIATSVTLGSGGSGGTLAPSLFIGAMAGGAFGNIVNVIAPSIAAPPGAYALVGMAAVTSATVQAPLAASILVFEMTDKYETILPLLIAVVAATYISKKYLKGSIYTISLKLKGQFLDVYGRDVNILRSIKVKDAMKPQLVAASESTRLSDLIEMIPESNTSVFPVIKHDGTLSGTISYGEIRQVMMDDTVKELLNVLVVKDILNPTNLSVLEDDDLSSAMKLMLDAGVPSVPVVREGNQLVGMLFLNDATQAYEKKLLLSEVAS
ncbi:MAG: chloride channel protein [Bacteroidetes bacterium]|nr:chloride channel protein [Bacteroidota bacterium]MCL5738584.1 chloride channel protein [Bacteroidota bacterium]